MNTELVSFPMHDVTAHGILDEKNRDTLHVQWILTQACNGRCSYCTQWSEMGNTVYVKERVLEIAYKILADRRPYYAFTFTGGEPTLHPHLTDILAYLYRSHTPLGVVVETNGLRNLDYYKELVEIAPKHTLQLTISAHLEKIALKALCFLIAMTAEHKQHAHVRLILDPNQRKKVRVFYDTLMKLRAVTPFTLDLWLLTRTENPLELDGRYTETDFSWYEDAQKRFDEINTTSPLSLPPLLPPVIPQFRYLTETKDVAWCDQEDTDLELEFKDFYCCLGTNFLRVSSDGTFQGALCCQARPQQPLWKETSHTSQTLKILQCASSCCVEERNAVLPKFRQKREAEDWVRDFEERRTAQKWEAAPLPHPVHPEPSLEDKVRIRLKRMQPENVSSPQGTPQPETIRQRFTDICTIYAALADEDSKEIFLRRIKFLETGDAGYTLLSAYSAGEHPEMPIYPEDEAFLETGTGYFRLLHLGGTTDNLALLTEQEKRIAYYQPKMRIALTAPEWCLDIPLHILEKYKGYTLLIGQHGTEANETWLYAIPPVLPKRYPVIPEELADKLPLVSVIVPTHNNEDTLKRCLDSALIQGIERMELIIIDDASTDKTPEIIAEYVRRYPKIVRTLRFAENKGPGPARNAGMDMAYGQYMTFIDSDDMLAEDFLKHGLEVMEKEDADIVAFDMVMNRDGEEVLWGVETGTWAGEASLRQFLLKKTGCYGTVCRLYRTNMLHLQCIEYADILLHEDIFFSVKAFYHSKKTIVISEIGYYRYIRSSSHSYADLGYAAVDSFFSFIGFLTNFFDAHNCNTDEEMYRYCIKKVYSWDRDRIFKTIIKAKQEKKLQDLLSEKNLLKLGMSKEAICCILADYALLHCYHKGLNPTVAPADLDWKAAAAKPCPSKKYAAYKATDSTEVPAPLLSVIIPNYNKSAYIKKCLDSIITQSMQDFEIIIIDDASTDNSWEILKNYADIYSYIQLYKMKYNCMQGVCRNIGIDLARGKYITFIDSDDYIEPIFFKVALAEISKEQADIIVFSTQDELPDGSKKDIYHTKKFRGHGADACTAYWSNLMPWGPWGKIFNTNFLKQNEELRFSEGVYHQDVYFMTYVTYASKLLVTSDIVVYNVVLSENSSIRRKSHSYVHIHSMIEYLNLKDLIYKKHFVKINFHDMAISGKFDIERTILPAINAFLIITGDVPLSYKDYKSISKNKLFLYCLCILYAECRIYNGIHDDISPISPQRIYKSFLPSKSLCPIISIIIPTYNQEAFIERCLKSVTNQSLKNLEIIIVNDASTDKTLDLCIAWQKKDHRIHIINNKKNMGQGYSRNKALKIARGKYITYIDSDDYILPNFLLRGLTILIHDITIDVIYFGYKRINEFNKLIYKTNQKNNIYTEKEVLLLRIERKFQSEAAWSAIYKMSLLRNNDILFPHFLYEDTSFSFRVAYFSKKICYIEEEAYVAVSTLHEASAVTPHKINKKHIDGNIKHYKDIYNFTKDKVDANLIYKYIENRQNNFGNKYFLPYIASFKDKGISPISEENIIDLKSTPPFLRYIFNEYAKLYCHHLNYVPSLTSEKINQQYKNLIPPTYLLSVSFYPELSEPIILSIIIPAYHSANNISRCLDSILEQNVNGIEILLIENCSSEDNTYTICEYYAHNNPKIRFFKTPWTCGLGNIYNLAIQQAKGRYLTFVDSNDFMAPNFFNQNLFSMLKESLCDVTNFSYYECSNKSNKIIKCNKMPNKYYTSNRENIQNYIKGTYNNSIIYSKIYSRSFILKNNISFETNFYDNESFLIKVHTSASKEVFYDIIAYYYSNKDYSYMDKLNIKNEGYCLKNLIRYVHMIFKILKYYKIEESIINKYIQRLNEQIWKHHKERVYKYIYFCNTFYKQTPLNDNILRTICSLKEYLRCIIMEYAILSQKEQKKDE